MSDRAYTIKQKAKFHINGDVLTVNDLYSTSSFARGLLTKYKWKRMELDPRTATELNNFLSRKTSFVYSYDSDGNKKAIIEPYIEREVCNGELDRKYRTHPAYLQKVRDKKIAIRDILREIKADKGCCICGMNNPICLHFHHLDERNKTNTISNMLKNGLASILAEIDGTNGSGGCVVVCSNCHLIEEERKLQFKREKYGDPHYKLSIWETLENWDVS